MIKKLWYRLLFWLTGTRPYLWAMKHFFPYIRFSLYYALPENTEFPQWGALEHRGFLRLKPGDLIFTIDNQKFSSKVIGSATKEVGGKSPYFMPSHIALCVELDTEAEILEMTHLDYTESTWEDVVRQSTRTVIARCSDWDQAYVNDVIIPTAKSFKGKKYDDRFQMGEDTLACSELPYFADQERRAKVNLAPVIGETPYITPVGWILGENIEIVWDSNLEFA
ncbi:hypothetical protein [Aureibacter tunicatorum]|uniref:Uncharacterized protein n=1 Tax=Aureibacter tunicatorum TaxID=866807 RepID=A0AAE3XMQ1_9BACT|nr:hypothetical protein [Aureibacter tunicatorum]MDR6238754.1 hypothetical protein [Aureibacter tunicatorum]BDD05315.1 hypothetical protein AUTU_27980 [Aureibacter tunicatorum]